MAGNIFFVMVAARVKGMSTRRAIDAGKRFARIVRQILTTMTHQLICVRIVAASRHNDCNNRIAGERFGIMENASSATPVDRLVMPSLDECEVRHLQTRYEQAIRYGIDLQQAIEYHCRGEIVPDRVAEGCPHHAEKLNARLQTLLQMLGSA
jgi:hypothetical protein